MADKGVRFRTHRMIIRLFQAGLCCAAAGVLLMGCREKKVHSEEIVKTSIFSWDDMYIYPDQEAQVSEVMEKLGCAAVYQEFPQDIDEEIVLDYLKRRSSRKQDVYYLTGAPQWGIEEHAKSMLEQVKRVCRLNKKAEKGSQFAGIVWDVEPYLTEEWDTQPDQTMEQYVKNCKTAYREAADNGLHIIVCIPNFYDKKGYEKELADLTENACDALAVMNYNKEDEAGQIRKEVELAETYGKGIIHIAELQKPGYHELIEKNTYYYDGIDAVKASFKELKKEFNYSGMGFSWHYMQPAVELLEREQ